MCHIVNISDTVDVLEICDIGLRCYRNAVAAGEIDPAAAVPCLLRLNLLAPGGNGMLTPVPPATAAALTIDPLRRRMALYQHHMVALEPSFAAATAAYAETRQNMSGEIRTIHGTETLSALLRLTVDTCGVELLTMQRGGTRPPELLDRALASELPALRRGVAQRTIYQHAIRSHPSTMDYIREITRAGGEVRTVGEAVNCLIICDRSVAFIPATSRGADQALEIRHPGLVGYLIGIFENTWQRAQPIEISSAQVRPPEVVDEIQKAILRFLVEGYTDAKIARQLGISQRTVATHIRKISDRLGSSSRAQLGYLIATNYRLDT